MQSGCLLASMGEKVEERERDHMVTERNETAVCRVPLHKDTLTPTRFCIVILFCKVRHYTEAFDPG